MTNNTAQPNPAPWATAHTVPLPTAARAARHLTAGVDTAAVAATRPAYRQDLAWSSERPEPELAQPRTYARRIHGWMLAAAAGGVATVAATGLFLTSHDGSPKPVAIDSSTVTTPAPAAQAPAAPPAAPAPAATHPAATHPATAVKASRTAPSDTPPAPQSPPHEASTPAPATEPAPSAWNGNSNRTWDRDDDGSWSGHGYGWTRHEDGSWTQNGTGTRTRDDGSTWQPDGGQTWQGRHGTQTNSPTWNFHRIAPRGGDGDKSFGGF